MSYVLKNPMLITSRLLPGVRVGDVYISIDALKRDSDGRVVCRYWFDFPIPEGKKRSRTFKGEDLRSGCGQAYDPRHMLETLLAFVEHAAERESGMRRRNEPQSVKTAAEETGFAPFVVEWASQNADEISMVRCELDEDSNPDAPDLCVEF